MTQTIHTYDTNATAYAAKFDATGARTSDIEEVFARIQRENPLVVEIGCGNGRDAEVILKHTNRYIGIDPSEGLLTIAQERNPHGKFILSGVESYEFPNGVDVVFAFASLLHVAKEDIRTMMKRIHTALAPGGIVRISLKQSPTYEFQDVDDGFGIRTFFFYSEEDVRELAQGLHISELHTVDRNSHAWLEVMLRK